MDKSLRTGFLFTMFISLLIVLSGCWSSTPIEELNFIAGSAIDKDKNGRIKSTLQYVVPSAIGKGIEGAAPQKPYINVSGVADSLEPSGWETTLKKEGKIFGAHSKAVVIGEEIAREINLRQLTDLYYRDIDIRGSTMIFVSKGRADKTLVTKEPNVIPAMKIVEIATQQSTTRLLKPTTLTSVWGKMNSGTSFLLQKVETKEGEVQFDGAAIFNGKNNLMIGTFNKKEIEGINWITGEGKGGSIKAYLKEAEKPTYVQIEGMKSKITPKVKGEKISFDVTIESEGRIAEYWNPYLKPLFKNKNVKPIEKAAEKEVKRLVEKVTKKMQEEYKVDVAGFGNRLRIEYPKLWEKVKKNWDQEFSTIPVNYHVNITVKDYGNIGAKKGKK
ncbi:Ger(x)C family spore germination protein [Peribacillus alkalitolerans]|uniref:Ger(x)C family spore germination protein n=1 Tax=Peribacillus alkalitolerans TaxID=1550385 RepID=UPI0013D878B2|nr:Ger(x)C family spore germination protein [Peribacillus alkalitolerans]